MQVVEHEKHIKIKLEFIFVLVFYFSLRKYASELSLSSS